MPTIAGTLPGFGIDIPSGLVAPAGTPRDVVGRLDAVLGAALQAPQTKARHAQLRDEPVASTPEQSAGLIQRELQRYETVAKASRAKAERRVGKNGADPRAAINDRPAVVIQGKYFTPRRRNWPQTQWHRNGTMRSRHNRWRPPT